jgi:hypothetical protein
MHAREGKIALARTSLDTLAANPHGGELAAAARKLSETMAKLPEGAAWEGDAELAAEGDADEGDA